PPSNGAAANRDARGAGMTRNDRPPWAGSGNSQRGGTMDRSNVGDYGRGGNQRNYEPPQHNNSNRAPSMGGNRGSYSQPRSYNPPSPRSYSQPRSYSAPQGGGGRSYSAPQSRGNSGGGSRGGGGSAPRSSGGGGSSHGGGGSSHGRH